MELGADSWAAKQPWEEAKKGSLEKYVRRNVLPGALLSPRYLAQSYPFPLRLWSWGGRAPTCTHPLHSRGCQKGPTACQGFPCYNQQPWG